MSRFSLIMTYLHTFQPPSSSKREVCNNPVQPSDSAMFVKTLDFRLSENLKIPSPGRFALHDYPRKLNFALSLRELS